MKKNKRQPRRSTRPRRTLAAPSGPGNSVIPRAMPLPTTLRTVLHFDDPTITRTNVGINNVGWRYRMTSAFDPDLGFLTGALPGFAEYANMYIAYRVIRFKWEVTIMSNELFPLIAYCVPLNQDPGSNPAAGLTLAANTRGSIRALSAIGGPGANFRGSLDLANFYGLRGQLYDDNFNAPVTSNPAVNIFFLIGAVAPSALTASGLVVRARLSYDVLFNRRKTLSA